MAQVPNIKGVQRDAEGVVKVLAPGGWLDLSMLSATAAAYTKSRPEASAALDPSSGDGWAPGQFKVVWGSDPDEEDPAEGGEGGANQLPQGAEPTKGGNPTPSDKFELPAAANMGSAGGGGGDDATFVTLVDPDTAESSLVVFDDAYRPRAEGLGQAIMTQTLDVTRSELALTAEALVADTKDYVDAQTAATLKVMDETLKSFVPETTGVTGAAQIVIHLGSPNKGTEPRTLEGLHHAMVPRLIKQISRGHHVYLPGPPGSSKSHSVKAAADALGWRFGSISLGPTTPESRFVGGMDAHGNFHTTSLTDGLAHAMEHPDQGFVFLLDEMDNGGAGNIATLNSLMANGWITLPNGQTHTVGRNLVFCGAANTYGTGPTAQFAGRTKLDPATLDRFKYMPWDTDVVLEKALVEAVLADNPSMASAWLHLWSETRANVARNNLSYFVTMRGAISGAEDLRDGDSLEEAWSETIGHKIPAEQLAKVTPF